MSNAEIRGLFVWHELMTIDPQGAAEFYAGLFRWQAHPSSVPGYTLWMSGEVGVGGLMSLPEQSCLSGTPPSWLVYLGSADVDATVEVAQRLGGRVLKEAADIPGIGRFAVLADPQGAAFSVFTPATPAPEGAAASGVISQFSWHELATPDPQGALDFYLPLFGWSLGEPHDMGGGEIYQIIERDGTPIGGVYRLQDPSRPAHWLTYVKVDNLDATVVAVRVAGGQVVQEPREVPSGDRVAWILDPQGGAIALHEAQQVIASLPAEPAQPAEPVQPRRTVVRRRSTRKRSARRATRRPTARAGGSAVGKVKAKAGAKAKVKAKSRVKAKAKAKAKGKSGKSKVTARKAPAKRATAKAAARKRPAKRATAKAAARKRPAKRATAKVTAHRNVKAKKAAGKARSAGKASRKHNVARKAKHKAVRRRR